MLAEKHIPSSGTVLTFEGRELIAALKAVDVLVVGWIDPFRGFLAMPIGDRNAVKPDTPIYQVRSEFEVAVLMATKQLLDEGDEDGAYSCLFEMADENVSRH